ncbi:luciferase family oxidoreductase group 1 [Pullulanibacillus pueri]|uniref:Luciferase-like domain-containing protein n=1 Tax=Pullulanibacillus pueri TaxID=1437324 RepID=A0A8J2ZUP0_9BACL|nr:LLM class flavin-dependent oxidoreductase [Pullulanibacillus pueri]MBM7681350.1 luciferase family oxidoreductase group 1 [Pullulanibacillus pueri]GGH77495.1 hypothetical protein GCM10007096_09470 [Pullulanibacillus pueri]
MKLSILDQSPIMRGSSPREALEASVTLAQLGEQLGYTRYWVAEHHDMAGLACPAPEVMLSYIGAHTKTMRIGSGAVLLPHYKPYKVAETFNLLATLFPGRIDLGVGRAPGGSAEASIALSGNFLENVRQMPDNLQALIHFLNNDFPADEMFSKIKASPQPDESPELWLLGTSNKSAKLAAEKGTAYAFGHFMSDDDGPKSVADYKKDFQTNGQFKHPQALVAVSVICAETTKEAEDIAYAVAIGNLQREKDFRHVGYPTVEEAKGYSLSTDEKEKLQESAKKVIVGNPAQVKTELLQLQERYQTEELMIITLTPTYEERLRSYRLIAEELL